jgi:hypothetical protein
MSVISSILSVVETELEAVGPAVLDTAAAAVSAANPLAGEAISALKGFLGTDLGKQVENWLSALVSHVVTPGSAVIVEPKTAVTAAVASGA